jgi:hypothetical protein
MDERLLVPIAVVEIALVAVALVVLIGHAGGVAAWRRWHGPRLVRAAATLAAAIDGAAPSRDDMAEFAALPVRAQIGVVSDLGESLGGVQKQRLAGLAAEVGLMQKAERWCLSRRWGIRLRGVRLLTLLEGGQTVVPPLLDDVRPEVRAQAAQWAGDHPEPEVIDRLIAMLADPETICRFTVQDSLLRVGRAGAEPLLRFLSNANGSAAAEALEVAAGIADARFLAPALDLCGASDARTRALAATLAGSVGGAQASAALVELLADCDPEVRAAAAKALGNLGHWPAAGTLAICLRDPSWQVRRAAAVALRALGGAGMMMLRRARSDGDRFARDMARQVLELPGGDKRPTALPDRESRGDEARAL